MTSLYCLNEGKLVSYALLAYCAFCECLLGKRGKPKVNRLELLAATWRQCTLHQEGTLIFQFHNRHELKAVLYKEAECQLVRCCRRTGCSETGWMDSETLDGKGAFVQIVPTLTSLLSPRHTSRNCFQTITTYFRGLRTIFEKHRCFQSWIVENWACPSFTNGFKVVSRLLRFGTSETRLLSKFW